MQFANYTTFLTEKELKQNIELFRNKLLKNIKEIKIIWNEEKILTDKNQFHFLLQLLESDNNIEKSLISLLVNSAYKAEKLSAGAGFVVLLNFLLNKKIKIREKKILKENNFSLILKDLCDNELLFELTKNALLISGIDGTIKIESGTQEHYFVEKTQGFTFPNLEFVNLNKTEKWTCDFPKIFCLDGVFEKVSQLEHLMYKLHETKEGFVVVAHGFSDDLIQTAKINKERNLLNIVLAKLPYDVDSMNIVNDISLISLGDLVSFLKGDSPIFKTYEDLSTVDKIICENNTLTIFNKKAIPHANQQIRELINRNEAMGNNDKRIKSLSSNCTTIFVNKENEKTNRIRIDTILRTIKSIFEYGYFETNQLEKNCRDFFSTEYFSVLSIEIGNHFGDLLRSEIDNVGGLVSKGSI